MNVDTLKALKHLKVQDRTAIKSHFEEESYWGMGGGLGVVVILYICMHLSVFVAKMCS